MTVINTEIKCTVDVSGKGYIYFLYSQYKDSEPIIQFEVNSYDLILEGRTVGKTYGFLPSAKAEYLKKAGNKLEDVLNADAIEAIRKSAKDLPDKLREGLGL